MGGKMKLKRLKAIVEIIWQGWKQEGGVFMKHDLNIWEIYCSRQDVMCGRKDIWNDHRQILQLCNYTELTWLLVTAFNMLHLSVTHQASPMVSDAPREGSTEAASNRYNTHSPKHTNSTSQTNSPSHTPAVAMTVPTTTSAAASFFAR